MFIVLDGGDFTGKSTVIKLLAERLRTAGYDCVTTNDPNSELPMAKALLNMLLNQVNKCHTAEMFCFLAARAELNEKVILPALEADKIVLCDRYISSTIAYQAFGRENMRVLDVVNDGLCTIESDYTFLLSVNDEVKKERMLARGDDIDEFDKLSDEFHNRVKAGYNFCSENPQFLCTDKLVEIDTSDKTIEGVVEHILLGLSSELDVL